MKYPKFAVAVLFTIGVVISIALAQAPSKSKPRATPASADWPCFRGPEKCGTSADKGLPLEWSDRTNIVWKTALPGAGASSPITFGDRVYVTTYSGYGLSKESPGELADLRRHLVCLSLKDGKILWDKPFHSDVPDCLYGDFINRHGYASSTPAVDATGIYTFFGAWGARAYNHDGTLKWEHSCGKMNFNFGSAASPLLFENLVFINATVEDRAVVALDKASGREVWRVPTLGFSYSMPLLVQGKSWQELIFPMGEDYEGGKPKTSGLAAVDPRTGSKLWQCTSIDAQLNPSPIAIDGVIYALANRGVAVRTGGQGDVTDSHLLWSINHGSEAGSPIFHQGHLYWVDHDGIAHCVNAKDGKVVYRERLNPSAGLVYASGVLAEGRIYYVSRENGTYVVAAEPRYTLLAHNLLDSDPSIFNGSPAVSRGRLLLRSDRYLYCIGKK